MTSPVVPTPDDGDQADSAAPQSGAPGAEIGLSEEGSTFEPEEDEDSPA